MLPYSCWFFRICWAYADLGSLFLMQRMCSRYLCVGSLLVCPIYDMLHVLQVSLYTPILLQSGIFFWVIGFDALLYCVCAFESDVYVCMFKKIGKLSDFRAVVCKCCPSFYLLLFLCELCAVFVFLVLLCVYSRSNCSALWFVLFRIPSVVFLLLVGVTAFC